MERVRRVAFDHSPTYTWIRNFRHNFRQFCQYVPKLQSLQNAKVVVYGYTDDLQVGPALQRLGIANNIDLSSRRADNVVAYFRSQGVNPGILSAKGFGDTHPVASDDSQEGRAQNRRIEIVLEGPGA